MELSDGEGLPWSFQGGEAQSGANRGGDPERWTDPPSFFAGQVLQRFSKSQVVKAGKAIAGSHPVHTKELIEAFGLAHAWRDGHIVPMRRVRRNLSDVVAKISPTAITAGRLKRFQSIRRKLKGGRVSLYQMQDIAGVRAIVPDIASCQLVADFYRSERSRYELLGEDNYIDLPKTGGYRSHHLILKFNGPEDVTAGNRITVELQVRTRLQHAWATAVEAVGLVRGQNLKAGVGDADWLRLFVLMSAEFAMEEGAPIGPGVPLDVEERRAELLAVADRTDAVKTLESYNQALRQTEGFLGLRGSSYLIQYNAETRQVNVRTYSSYSRLSEQYFNDEVLNDEPNTVLVEIDKVDDLREAYPNYFLDVRMFTDRMKAVLFPLARPGSFRPTSKWASILGWTR